MTEEVEHPIIRSSTPIRAFHNLGDVCAVAVFPDTRRMAMNSSDGMLRLWDLKTGVMLKELEGRGDPMRDVALSRDGQLIASSDDAGYVTVWHGDTGRPLTQAFKAHSGSRSLDFSPDGTTLATTSWDATGLWSTETWQQVGSSIGCGYAYCIRYSPSGELLAIATHYNIQIWNPATRQCITKLADGFSSVSLVWTPDSARLLSADRDNTTIQQWDSSTWSQLGDIWKGSTGYPRWFAVNCNGTVVAFPAADNQIRLWRLSDRRTIAIFQHSDTPCCVTFSTDGKHILAGGKDRKISEWAVPEHAWPEDVPTDQTTHQSRDCITDAQDSDTKAQGSDTKAQDSDTESRDIATKIFAMNTTVRNICISGDLPTAEELLTQEIEATSDNYRSYANRSVVMARKLDWEHALDDAIKSLSIQPSLMGYISKGIALCGTRQVRAAREAFDLASSFADGPKINHFLLMIKAIALFNGGQHAEGMRRIRELAAVCPDPDTTLACRTIEVYLHIQLGNKALDRACSAEAADHFTAAVNANAFLSKSPIDSRYDEFVVLFGCDFTSLWPTAHQKRCHALLRAGKLTEVFEAYQHMADMSDETTRASCLNWSIDFIRELSTFRDHAPNASATRNIMECKYDDDENVSISDIDSDIDHVDDALC